MKRTLFLTIAIVAFHGPMTFAEPESDRILQEFNTAVDEFDQAQQIQHEDPDRARKLFHSAANRFQGVATSGIENGRLEYNIGNAFLQSGDIGRAILHYRRAKRLIPNDGLLKDNLSFARSKCLTSVPPTSQSQVLRTVFFMHYLTTMAERTMLGLTFYILFWLLLILRNWLPRRSVLTGAIVSLAIAVTLGASVAVSTWMDRNEPPGVVLGVDVPVYKGPGDTYQRQFEQPLQPGVEFTLLDRRGEWWNVELADGKGGWIRAADAELVPIDADLQLKLVS